MLAGSNSEEGINGDLANMYRQGKGPLKRNFSTLSWFLCQSLFLIRKTEQHFFKLVNDFWQNDSFTTMQYKFAHNSFFNWLSIIERMVIVSIVEKMMFSIDQQYRRKSVKNGYFIKRVLKIPE